MKPFEQGLRCQDIHAGLREIDPNAPALTPLVDTRLIGMAASLATAIRGQDVIENAEVLMEVAVSELDVSALAFNDVIEILDTAGFVHSVHKSGTKIKHFSESVPFHESLYDTLGKVWKEREPTEKEQEVVATVHRLARGPVATDVLADAVNIDPSHVTEIVTLAKSASLIRTVETQDGEILYSPFMAFEHPQAIADVLAEYGPDRLQEELDQVKHYQGLPIGTSQHPALVAAVTSGLIMAPSVERPDAGIQSFACLPYAPDHQLFSTRKSVLDKALALVACVRCGQHFGGATSISSPARILRKLLNGDHMLGAHSSARRQYQPLFRMQIVDFVPSGNWVQPRLIDTEDNLDAVRLALDLVTFGESMTDRAGTDDVGQLLLNGATYLSPMRTVQNRRRSQPLDDARYERLMGVLMGRAPL